MSNRMSVATIDSPEFINLQPMDINPLMSKCDIKVLYLGQNRNHSYIDKDVAIEMSKTLRGAPIVGYYIENKEDFGDHGDQMIIDGEGIKFNKLTKPYGFVAPDSKVWFQNFEDTDEFGNSCIREYLMTEGYLWTGQFEECQRVIDQGNPQSMELDEKTLKGHWSTDSNRGIDFFIINDAVFSKLCILGEDVEPCFEGANVTEPILSSKFSKDDDFSKSLFTMMKELNFALNNSEGGKPMHSAIQNELDNNVESTIFENQGNVEAPGVNFEDGGESSAAEGSDGDSTESGETSDNQTEGTPDQTETNEPATDENEDSSEEEGGVESAPAESESDDTIDSSSDVSKKKIEVPTSILENKKAEEDKDNKSDSEKSEDNTEDEEEKDKNKNKKEFSLEEKYEELQTRFAALEAENAKLLSFKEKVEDKEKDDLINSFYMLSEDDKKDVIKNKKNYSLKEIKAELSMICVDKKVSFNLEDTSSNEGVSVTYNLDSHQADTLPAWLKGVEETRNRMSN